MICRKLLKNLNLGMGWFGQGENSQGIFCPRDATSKHIRLGTHRSGTDYNWDWPLLLGEGGGEGVLDPDYVAAKNSGLSSEKSRNLS
jgi:hypothetical protein